MRGDSGDRFDPLGTDRSEPGGFVLSIWAGVAGLALILALVAWQYGSPDQNGIDRIPSARATDTVLAAPSPSGAAAFGPDTGQMAEVAAELARQRVENAALRKAMDVMRGQIDGLSDRIADLERQIPDITGTITPGSGAVPPAVSGPDFAVVGPPDVSLGIVTGPPTAGQTRFGVELGTFADLVSLRDEWLRIRRENPALFGDLDAIATIRDRQGRTELLLVAGPFSNATDAANLCGRAADVDVACLPAFYVGQPL